LYIISDKSAHTWLFGPSSYEDCVNTKLKLVDSDVAVRAIIAECRKKFPTEEQKKEIENLKSEAERKEKEEKKIPMKTLNVSDQAQLFFLM